MSNLFRTQQPKMPPAKFIVQFHSNTSICLCPSDILENLNLETPTRCLSDLETSKLTNEIAQFKLANSKLSDLETSKLTNEIAQFKLAKLLQEIRLINIKKSSLASQTPSQIQNLLSL